MRSKIKLFLFLITTCFSFAQENGTVKGLLISSDGLPISGIAIKIGKAAITSKTTEKGEFVFQNFPIGIHTITIEGEGMKRQSKEIKVQANEISFVTFKLEENRESLKEVIIKIKDSPNKKKEVLLSGLEIRSFDLPQSVQIVSKNTIEQQQSIRLSDVVKNVNGVYVGSARGGAQESFWSRGYDMTANNMFKNGFRYSAGSMPEVSTLEKIEVLKGSAALLFGNVAPGGILNMVTKKPSFTKGGEIGMQIGSFSFYKPSIAIFGPLNKYVAYQFVGTFENSESFRDVVTTSRLYVNPSVLFKVNNKTDFLVQADYLKDNWTPDFGTGSIGKNILNIARNKYLGANWSNGLTKQSSLSGLLKHKFKENWDLNFNSAYQNYDRIWEGTERIVPKENGDWSRPLGKNQVGERILSSQINLQGILYFGKTKHQLFSGIDAENSLAKAYTFVYNPLIYDTINIFSLDTNSQRTDIPQAKNTRIVNTETTRFGIYVQDLISFSEKIKVLAGIRWSWQESEASTINQITKSETKEEKRFDAAFIPKIGLVYQPTKSMSVFSSYATSFTPNTGLNIYNKPLESSYINQYEVGIKKDFWHGLLSTNLTLYKIVNSNLAQTAEFNSDGSINTNTNIKTLIGETKSEGIEIDLSSMPIEGLNIMAGYSYNDMRFTKTSGNTGSFIAGDRLVRTPANTANLSAFYTFSSGKLKGVSLGTIGNYIGERLGGWNNQIDPSLPNGIYDREIPIKGYATIDASVGYNWKQFSLLCKLSNITNVLNYTVHENYSMNPIAPRQIMTTLKYKF